MALTPGKVLQNGKYTIDRELRRDWYSISYLAQGSDGHRWVIKILDPAVLKKLRAEEQRSLQLTFQNEVTVLVKCTDQSRYIVKVDFPFITVTVTDQHIVCMPFEYLGNTTLQDRSQRILKEETALEYIRQLSEAVKILHSQDLVHRDIRPANIFLRIEDDKAEAVLTDFDLAVDCDTSWSRTRANKRTNDFSPIELYSRDQPVGPYTDVYSLAATLYEMLTGTTPVSAESRKEDKTKWESPQVKNPEISGRVAKAIKAGMEILPEKRPQTLQAWLQQLGLGEASDPKASGQDSVVKPEAVNWSKWGVIWAAIGLLISLFAAIPAWLALKPEAAPPNPPTPTTQPTP